MKRRCKTFVTYPGVWKCCQCEPGFGVFNPYSEVTCRTCGHRRCKPLKPRPKKVPTRFDRPSPI